jgi:serine/threonine protein kinase
MSTPAEQLKGQALAGGWVVGDLIPRTGTQTGGHFSCSYLVTNADGRTAFLKAMDYTRALTAPDPAMALNQLTSAFLFERQILQECSDRRMSRIVRAIDGGKTVVAGAAVEYLIFEHARGDIRAYLDASKQFDLIWTIACLHNICVGMQQLNLAQMAHQDLKPSNVLDFEQEGQKLADLGRAWHQARVSPHDALPCAGDRGYAPPELLYGHTMPDETERRYGTDFYLLGSMILFLFTGMRASALLLSEVDPQYHPRRWRGTYADVLPYLCHAFSINLTTIRNSFPDQAFGAEVVDIVQQMCDPNIATRGDKMHRSMHGSRFGLQRFVSRFDRLRAAARLGKFKHP